MLKGFRLIFFRTKNISRSRKNVNRHVIIKIIAFLFLKQPPVFGTVLNIIYFRLVVEVAFRQRRFSFYCVLRYVSKNINQPSGELYCRLRYENRTSDEYFHFFRP